MVARRRAAINPATLCGAPCAGSVAESFQPGVRACGGAGMRERSSDFDGKEQTVGAPEHEIGGDEVVDVREWRDRGSEQDDSDDDWDDEDADG